MKSKPQRMCSVCRQHKDKDQMVRVVKTANGEIVIASKHTEGRGAYVCLDDNCINKFEKSKCLNRAFKCEVKQEIYEKLKEELAIAKSANK